MVAWLRLAEQARWLLHTGLGTVLVDDDDAMPLLDGQVLRSPVIAMPA
ncbi:hypothetical protein [Sorangium sp. So ce381]